MKAPAIELADVMRTFFGRYLQAYGERMPAMHHKAMADIIACRTPVMGGTTFWCPSCHHYQYSYHSCGNRNCNKCGNEKAQQWLEQTGKLLLPVEHFMVTFTLPGKLCRLARSHQKLFYGLLMSCAAASLQTLGWDSRLVGGRLAMMGVLHTWTRDLNYHPHVHMIVAGGGLWPDEGLWLESRRDFLVPVKALSVIFASKFRDGLKKQAPDLYATIDPCVWPHPWVVHCQPVGCGQAALKYLAAYVFRPAISNKHLVSMAGGKVTYRWQHSQTNQWKITTQDAIGFIRRYLQHVLPRRFVKVRYYGVYAHRHRQVLDQLHRQLSPQTADTLNPQTDQKIPDEESIEPVRANAPACPCCGKPMRMIEHIPRGGPWPNAPPHQHTGGNQHQNLSTKLHVPVNQP